MLTDEQRCAFEKLANSDLPVSQWAEKLLAVADNQNRN